MHCFWLKTERAFTLPHSPAISALLQSALADKRSQKLARSCHSIFFLWVTSCRHLCARGWLASPACAARGQARGCRASAGAARRPSSSAPAPARSLRHRCDRHGGRWRRTGSTVVTAVATSFRTHPSARSAARVKRSGTSCAARTGGPVRLGGWFCCSSRSASGRFGR